MKLTVGLAVLSLAFCVSAQAEDNRSSEAVEIATIPVCQTQEDVRRYIALYDGDQQATITNLNAEVRDPHACGVATVAYLRGPQIGGDWKHDMAFEVRRILVIGLDTNRGFLSVQPVAYFAIFSVQEPAV